MKKFDLGQTITILANIGVLVGLLLVAIQINQNTKIAEAQLANDYFLADMQLELSIGKLDADNFAGCLFNRGSVQWSAVTEFQDRRAVVGLSCY